MIRKRVQILVSPENHEWLQNEMPAGVRSGLIDALLAIFKKHYRIKGAQAVVELQNDQLDFTLTTR